MSGIDQSLYPTPPADARAITGGTLSGDTATATTGTVTVTRDVYPLFVAGSAGTLTWSVQIVADAAITSATFSIASGAYRPSVTRTASPASAVLSIPAGDDTVTLSIVVECTSGTDFDITETYEQATTEVADVMLADAQFGEVSSNGVEPPEPSAGLPGREALSPARRSPQVRAAQRIGSARPDLLDRASSLD